MVYTKTGPFVNNTTPPGVSAAFLNAVEVQLAGRNGIGLIVAASNAPQAMKDRADYVCSGSADDVQINAALSAAIGTNDASTNLGGGKVYLTAGTFSINSPIRLKGRTDLEGAGFATRLKATSTLAALTGDERALMTANYSGTGDAIDGFGVRNLFLDGNALSVHAIYSNITTQGVNWDGSPDTVGSLFNLWMHSCNLESLKTTGSQNRAWRVEFIRIWNAGNGVPAVDWGCTDSFLRSIDIGSAGSSGVITPSFVVNGGENHWTDCKAWLGKGDGFQVNSNGNHFTACMAHHNNGHGWVISIDRLMFSGCGAYNNGQQTLNTYDGFHLTVGKLSMAGCRSWSITAAGYSASQRYGFYVSGIAGAAIQGSTSGNLTASVGGSAAASSVISVADA